mmetsp:Transcript_37116/g.54614  ORF Transcript_37116/g.54614 Transcript_37116/m.54614 type:complete len:80 (-) Transcript_37116:12-251(-)
MWLPPRKMASILSSLLLCSSCCASHSNNADSMESRQVENDEGSLARSSGMTTLGFCNPLDRGEGQEARGQLQREVGCWL